MTYFWKVCSLITAGLKCWSYPWTPWSPFTTAWFGHSVCIFHRRSRPGLPWIRKFVHISQTFTSKLRIWVCCMIYHIIGFSEWYNWKSSWVRLNTFGVSTDSKYLFFSEHEIWFWAWKTDINKVDLVHRIMQPFMKHNFKKNARAINHLFYAKMLSKITTITCYRLVTLKYLLLKKEAR